MKKVKLYYFPQQDMIKTCEEWTQKIGKYYNVKERLYTVNDSISTVGNKEHIERYLKVNHAVYLGEL